MGKDIMKRFVLLTIAIMTIIMITDTVFALPEALDNFNAKYNTYGTRLDSCDLCHIPNKPQMATCDEACHVPNKKPTVQDENSLNSYGMDFKNNISYGIGEALSRIELLDSDGDKYSNIDEINNLTMPGDKKDFPKGKGNPNSLLSSLSSLLNVFNVQ